jgi:uncharacterized RDD family membrane protein YckC
MTRQAVLAKSMRAGGAGARRWLLTLLLLMSSLTALSASAHSRHEDDDDAGGGENGVVAIGHSANLGAGQQANDVIAILGSANSEGQVGDSVVAVLGSAHVTGPVGQAVVSVLGSSYIDSAVGGDVVAVLGSVELGPHAVIGGQVVVVGGALKRDPGAVVGGERNVVLGSSGYLDQLKNPWVRHCLLLGRPLALDPRVYWAWIVAFGVLAVYLLLSLLLHGSVERGARTLEQHPGPSLLAAVLVLVGIPVLLVILVVTVIGVIAVPFVLLAVVLLQVFGKIVMLAWIGRRVVGAPQTATPPQVVRSVLVGGLIVLALYVIPGAGFLVYKLLDLIGLGVLAYVLVQGSQSRPAHASVAAAPEVAPGPGSAPGSAPEATPRRGRVGPSEALTLPRAGFWIRMAALFIDGVLVAILLDLSHASSNLFLIALACYGAIMWKVRGSTVGGLVCSLAVVRSDGQPMDWGTVLVRALGGFVSLIVVGLGFVWISIDREKRGWHDKIAGTLVVRVP